MNHWLNEGRQILDEKQIDQYNKIERRPTLGCLIVVGGRSCFGHLFIGFIYYSPHNLIYYKILFIF